VTKGAMTKRMFVEIGYSEKLRFPKKTMPTTSVMLPRIMSAMAGRISLDGGAANFDNSVCCSPLVDPTPPPRPTPPPVVAAPMPMVDVDILLRPPAWIIEANFHSSLLHFGHVIYISLYVHIWESSV